MRIVDIENDGDNDLYGANWQGNQVELWEAKLTISGNAGIGEATLWFTDNGTKTVTADINGDYSIIVPNGWSGTVTPYKSGYTFTPTSRSYSNVQGNLIDQNYTAQACVGCADIDVSIGGELGGSYTLASGQSRREFYDVDSGPVQVESTNHVPITAALLDVWLQRGTNIVTSYAQFMGLPKEKLSATYYFPSYNNRTLSGQLRFSNVGTAETKVRVYIGGIERGSYLLQPNEQRREFYDLDTGPVVVSSEPVQAGDPPSQPIIAALLDVWLQPGTGTVTSYAQLMGLPQESLSTTYYFPSYNNKTLSGQLRFSNLGTAATKVRVYIGGIERGSYLLQPNEQRREFYDLDTGPVVISSEPVQAGDPPSQPIIAALLDVWLQPGTGTVTSYHQMMGLPQEQLSATYSFPGYNNKTLSGQLRFSNVGTAATKVRVYIGGIERGNYVLQPNEQRREFYDLDTGPVVVSSEPVQAGDPASQPIIAALLDVWLAKSDIYDGGKLLVKTGTVSSYSQMMGFPELLLSDTYFFPSYNNRTLSGQLRFGVP